MANNTVYQIVTDRIISELEDGVIPWRKPWTGTRSGAYSRATGKPYSIINQFMLKPGEYATFKQINEAGGKVKKGSKSSIVVFWKMIPIVDKDKDGKEITKNIPFLQYYRVFHIDQCENIEPKYTIEDLKPQEPIVEAEELIKEYTERESPLCIRNITSNEAYYSPSEDRITMPKMEQFQCAEEYYSTLFHEVIHSTGSESRLNRIQNNAAFGDKSYGKEELTAEIGSATLVNMMGLETSKSFKNSIAYINSWIKAIKEDPALIVTAAGKAQKAIDYIIGEAE